MIVRSSNALYVVAATKESGNRVYRLHALDITTGAAKFGSPAVISGSVLGSAGDAVGGVVTFNANKQLQRTGLAAAGASIVIAFSGDRDHGPYHGWVFAYHATTLAGTGVFSAARNNSTANGEGNGIWQSGRAPAVDGSGAVYLETGNGPYDGANDFGESFLKLTPGSSSLSLSDWFTPSNWSSLNTYDFDLGSTGPTVIPGSNLVFGGSKTGAVFLLATGNLGQLSPGNTNIAQEFLATSGCQAPLALQGCAQIMGHVFWATASTPILYVWGVHDVPRAYNFSSNRFVTTARDTGSLQATYPGGVLGLSSYQGVAGTGILWAITNETPDNGFYFGPGFTGTARLRAYDATNLASELWNSGQNVLRDDIGTFASFAPPDHREWQGLRADVLRQAGGLRPAERPGLGRRQWRFDRQLRGHRDRKGGLRKVVGADRLRPARGRERGRRGQYPRLGHRLAKGDGRGLQLTFKADGSSPRRSRAVRPPAVLLSRPKAPFGHRLDRLLVEAEAETARDPDAGGLAAGVDRRCGGRRSPGASPCAPPRCNRARSSTGGRRR